LHAKLRPINVKVFQYCDTSIPNLKPKKCRFLPIFIVNLFKESILGGTVSGEQALKVGCDRKTKPNQFDSNWKTDHYYKNKQSKNDKWRGFVNKH